MSKKIYPGSACRLEFIVEDTDGLPVPSLTHSDVSSSAYRNRTNGVQSVATTATVTSSVESTAAVSAGQFVTIDSARGHYAIDVASGAAGATLDVVEAVVAFTAGHTVTPIQHEIDETLYELNTFIDYALVKLALLGVVADAVVVPAGTFLCGRGDIEQIFGTTAVAKWGDLNNNEDADEITSRINYRISIADSFMRSTLGNSAWVLPEEGDAIPPILAYYTACLAGVLLYEGRGVQDYDARGNAQHQLSFHKKGVEDFVKGVLFGSVSLAPLEYNVASAAPEAT